mmetsp:Transcript_12781/g.27178  ORF Transcript_12781/g.27178 Transcript_12781/m.27178 type:complete len:443 (+) Transcript_12781:230-1558(+)
MIFVQMEALTGWAAKDEWDFEFLGYTNNPFIKANYPHHEGIWGWGDAADQMVLMIRNMRRSLVEYHDILWDIDYAKTWEEATVNLNNLYGERAPIEDFLVWRDDRVMDEVHWYGWEIDYWMEGGLLRDMFSHNITTPEHFQLTMNPVVNHRDDLEQFYTDYVAPGVADGTIQPSYDTNCANGFITDGCAPKAVLSAERLRDYSLGAAETARVAQVLLNDARMGEYVIHERAWNCVWEELIVNGKGLKTVYDRPGFQESDYNFSQEMLEEMIKELSRLISKYSSPEWSGKETALRVVELLVEHRALIQTELNQVNSGQRQLTDNDFLGPKERERRRLQKLGEEGKSDEPKRKDYTKYFNIIREKVTDIQNKRRLEQLLKETKQTMDAFVQAGETKNLDMAAISNAKSKIRMLETSGRLDQLSVTNAMMKIDEMAKAAKLAVMA